MLIINKHFNFCCFSALAYTTLDRLCAVFTRHSLVRAKDEVFVLLYVFLFVFFCSVNDFSKTRGPIHAKVCMRAYSGSGCVFAPFAG